MQIPLCRLVFVYVFIYFVSPRAVLFRLGIGQLKGRMRRFTYSLQLLAQVLRNLSMKLHTMTNLSYPSMQTSWAWSFCKLTIRCYHRRKHSKSYPKHVFFPLARGRAPIQTGIGHFLQTLYKGRLHGNHSSAHTSGQARVFVWGFLYSNSGRLIPRKAARKTTTTSRSVLSSLDSFQTHTHKHFSFITTKNVYFILQLFSGWN